VCRRTVVDILGCGETRDFLAKPFQGNLVAWKNSPDRIQVRQNQRFQFMTLQVGLEARFTQVPLDGLLHSLDVCNRADRA